MIRAVFQTSFLLVVALPSAWLLRLMAWAGLLPSLAILGWMATSLVGVLAAAIMPSPDHWLWWSRFDERVPGWLLGQFAPLASWPHPEQAMAHAMVTAIRITACLLVLMWLTLTAIVRLPLRFLRGVVRHPAWLPLRRIAVREARALRSLRRRRPAVRWLFIGTPLMSGRPVGWAALLAGAVLTAGLVCLGRLLRDAAVVAALPQHAFVILLADGVVVEAFDALLDILGRFDVSSRWAMMAMAREGTLFPAAPIPRELAIGFLVQAAVGLMMLFMGLFLLSLQLLLSSRTGGK